MKIYTKPVKQQLLRLRRDVAGNIVIELCNQKNELYHCGILIEIGSASIRRMANVLYYETDIKHTFELEFEHKLIIKN